MAATAKELREKRAKLIADARKYLEERQAANTWDKEAEAAFDKMVGDAERMGDDARRIETLERQEARLGDRSNPNVPQPDPQTKPGQGDAQKALTRIRVGTNTKGQPRYEDRPASRRGQQGYREAITEYLTEGVIAKERRANLQSDDDEKGGYLVTSEQFAAGLLAEVDDEVFVRRYAQIFTVPEATSLGIRKRVGRMSTFAYGTELEVQANDTALKFGKKVLHPHPLTGSCRVSRDNLRRNLLGADRIVMAEMARDAGEVQETKFLYGTGAQQPLGVFVASADGIPTTRDVVTGSATSITADGLIDAKYALKAQYRLPTGSRSGARWFFHRDAMKIIAKLKDNQLQYLWTMSLREGEPDLILGLPVDESEKAPNTFTNGLYAGLLAQWFYYGVADALDMEVQALFELRAFSNEVEYIGRLKNDGMPLLEEAFVRLKCGT